MSLYNAKTDTGAASYGVKQFIINKFDDDLNVEASYITTHEGCTCPAGVRPTCRHRQMLSMLETKANTAWFLDFDTRTWVDPTGEAQALPEGSVALVLDDPAAVHNAIAEAVGEPVVDVAATPQRTVHEEQSPPEPITRVDDSHPFRRRM